VLFEIGYALGLGVPVQPARDRNYAQDAKAFDELGMLDTFGYSPFQNSEELATEIANYRPQAIAPQTATINREAPLYLVRGHVQNDGMVKLMSALKKSGLRFRAFDPRETSRLSLHEAIKQVQMSLGVIVHLVAPKRDGAVVNNARCALVAGLAMAQGKHVLMLQEGEERHSIDFRDVVRAYTNSSQVSDFVIPLIKGVVEELQETRFVATALPLNLIEKIDLGDLAAENEIKGLSSYFVPTGQYNEAKRGRAQIVVGRKGSGKTAIFYGVRSTYKPSRAHIVLDLKPEGHQFTKLREALLQPLSTGVQQHVLTAFWNYLLLMEIARKIVEEEGRLSYRQAYQVRDQWTTALP
jgi:nucleoside 2-deoxyribosyltransferase